MLYLGQVLKDKYKNYAAIFIADKSIIAKNRTILFNFTNLTKKLNFSIQSIYLDINNLIVKCSDLYDTNEFRAQDIKLFLPNLCPQEQVIVKRAVQWLNFEQNNKYCARCGSKMSVFTINIYEKKCSTCSHSIFPNISPAIIVLIQKNNQVLLARSSHFKSGVYGLIAGFIDIGESAEEAVHREVMEEVGLEVKEIEYFGSQSWPFPGSFMIAFKAQWSKGDISIDFNELEDARWFDINHLPEIPSTSSIANSLIRSVVQSRL